MTMPGGPTVRARVAAGALGAVLTVVVPLGAACSTGIERDLRAITPAPPSEASGFPVGWTPPELTWDDCPIRSSDSTECATLAVPLDWSDPGGPAIDLAISRIPARGDWMGSLVTNPGGPGASGLDFLAAQPFSSALAERFDLVSWDPRGVGASTAVDCDSAVPDFLALDPDPDGADEQNALEEAAAEVSTECDDTSGELLPHLSTDEVARDLEAIRLALGSESLNYLGFSYGTQIGLQYAEHFGDRIRAMALDGVVDPALGFEDFLLGQTGAFEEAFDRWVESCDDAGASGCGVSDLRDAYDRVAESAESDPLPGGPDGVGPAVVAAAAISSTYRTDGWASLGTALADALDGDGDALWSLAASLYDFDGYDGYAAVVCTDAPHPVGTDAYEEFAERATGISARFGPSVANEMLPCATWPAPPASTPTAVTAPGSPPILVVGGTEDPATPLANAISVDSTLEDSRLLVVDIDGHTSYGSSACATAAIDDYLLDLTLPREGTTC